MSSFYKKEHHTHKHIFTLQHRTRSQKPNITFLSVKILYNFYFKPAFCTHLDLIVNENQWHPHSVTTYVTNTNAKYVKAPRLWCACMPGTAKGACVGVAAGCVGVAAGCAGVAAGCVGVATARLMRLDAAYEISISVSWKTMLSPSGTCTTTIKKYYEKLKDATAERKK